MKSPVTSLWSDSDSSGDNEIEKKKGEGDIVTIMSDSENSENESGKKTKVIVRESLSDDLFSNIFKVQVL